MKLPKLLQLAVDNLNTPKRFEAKEENGVASLYVYDVIDDYYGVSAEAFVNAINAIEAPEIHLHINSPGGDVFAARAMVAAIATHKSKIISYVDGLAASAASYLALSANEVVMAKGSFLMVHRAWTGLFGNSEDLRTTAALLDKIDASIVDDYVRKTGKSKEEIEQLMAAESWLEANEAKEFGFADSVTENEKGAKNKWNLSAYDKAPEALKLVPEEEKPQPDAEIQEQINSQIQRNRNRLRLHEIG